MEQFLIEDLVSFLRGCLAEFRLEVPGKDGEFRAPKVFKAYLPPKRQGDDEDFPFVVVRPEGGETDRDSTRAQVAIVIGCYSEDLAGYEYCLNLVTHIRQALMSLPGGVLNRQHVLDEPISWQNLPEQPYPYWQVSMTTNWLLRSPGALF